MLRNVIVIEHDGFKERVLSILFDVPNEEFDLISAAKAAAAEYCKTEEGLKTYFYNGESFDWADFEMSVPNEICERHGMSSLLLELKCPKATTSRKSTSVSMTSSGMLMTATILTSRKK